MLGILIFLGIILVLILINKNTKSTPEGMGCVQQGCLLLFALFLWASWSGSGQVQPGVSRPAPAPQVVFTDITIADAATPLVHRASFDASTSKIIVNCYVSGALPGTPLTAKWILLWSGTRQLLQQATFSATGPSHPAFFSAKRPSNQNWPVGTYEVELWANDVHCETVTFWVNP